jgi:hypothetical protein
MTMPMQLLERLNCANLPMDIDEADDIEECRVLRAARLIEADIPPVLHLRGRSSYAGHATVICVTAGRHKQPQARGRTGRRVVLCRAAHLAQARTAAASVGTAPRLQRPRLRDQGRGRDRPVLEPAGHAAVFCVDEKTAIQALDRKDRMLPLAPGRAESHGFEYKRNGTLSLFAALKALVEVLYERGTSFQMLAEPLPVEDKQAGNALRRVLRTSFPSNLPHDVHLGFGCD